MYKFEQLHSLLSSTKPFEDDIYRHLSFTVGVLYPFDTFSKMNCGAISSD